MTTITPRSNYDSGGLSTGLAVADVFAGLELQFIANRKKLFTDAIKSADSFKEECIRRFRAYDEASRAAVTGAMNEVAELTGREIGRAYNSGVRSVDESVSDFKRQGFEPDGQPNDKGLNTRKLAFASGVLQMFAGVSGYAKQAADNQLKYIVAQVNPRADNIADEIDRAQAVLLAKGVPGRSLATGAEKSMTAEAEFIMRNQSAEALRAAKGERRAQYGLKYVRVSAHPSSCPLCVPWQNKVLIDDRYADTTASGGYELLSTAIAGGLWHFNCRHEVTEELPGYSNPNRNDYNQASPQETAKRYAVEQQQRYNERNIRAYKIKAEGLMDDTQKALAEMKVSEWQARQRALRDLAEREGVPFYRQYDREQIGGETKPTLKPLPNGRA